MNTTEIKVDPENLENLENQVSDPVEAALKSIDPIWPSSYIETTAVPMGATLKPTFPVRSVREAFEAEAEALALKDRANQLTWGEGAYTAATWLASMATLEGGTLEALVADGAKLVRDRYHDHSYELANPFSSSDRTHLVSLAWSVKRYLEGRSPQGSDGWGATERRHKWLADVAELAASKQRDYGTGNILAFGQQGILVRLSDKFARLENLLISGADAENESLADTLDDIAGYCIVSEMLARGTFEAPLDVPEPEPAQPVALEAQAVEAVEIGPELVGRTIWDPQPNADGTRRVKPLTIGSVQWHPNPVSALPFLTLVCGQRSVTLENVQPSTHAIACLAEPLQPWVGS